jgi:hypothetical protein
MGAIFKKQHLKDYKVADKPGTYIVKVANTVKTHHLYDANTNKARYLVNLKCSTLPKLLECLEIMGDKEEIEFKEVKHCFLTGVIWENELKDSEHLPIKNENVITSFDYIDNELLCKSLSLIPRKELENFNLNAYCKNRSLLLKLLQE